MREIVVMCNMCKEAHIINVKSEDYHRHSLGELIQNTFPYLSSSERELLISGTCGECFDKMFAE